MPRNTERLGALLIGVGLGILIVRLLPWLVWFWPLGLIAGGLMLWRRIGPPPARVAVIVVAVTIGIFGQGGWFGWGAGRVVAQYQSGESQANAWREMETLIVRNTVGDVVVEGGSDEPSVSVTYRSRRPGAAAPDGLQAEYDPGRRTLTVIGVNPDQPERNRRGLSADLILQVPEGTRLELENRVGDIEAEVLAAADVQLDVGDVQLERISGAVTVQSDVGELELASARGPVEIDLDVGDIDMNFERPVNTPVYATTRVGDISMELPAGSDVTIRALSRTRGIEGDLQRVASGEGRLELGSGANEVYLETDVGEVEVERR